MTTVQELKNEFERHAVHVGHREDAERIVTTLDSLSQNRLRKVIIAPHSTIRNHHAFREACRSARIVEESHFVCILFNVVLNMLFPEELRIFLSEHLVQMLACIGQLVCPRHQQTVVWNVDNTFQPFHLRRINCRSHHIAYEQQLGFTVVHDVVDLFGRELM